MRINCCNYLHGGDRQVSMGELLGSRSVRIGMCLFLLQQASGINAIVYFSSSVFAQARRPCQPACVSVRAWPACRCFGHAPEEALDPYICHLCTTLKIQ